MKAVDLFLTDCMGVCDLLIYEVGDSSFRRENFVWIFQINRLIRKSHRK